MKIYLLTNPALFRIFYLRFTIYFLLLIYSSSGIFILYRMPFSQIPFNKKDHSQSRIDHFLCSLNFLKSLAHLTYLPKDIKFFEHTGVLLKTARKSPRNLSPWYFRFKTACQLGFPRNANIFCAKFA